MLQCVESSHESRHSAACFPSSHLWQFSKNPCIWLVHVRKMDPIKKGLSTERFSPQISQEHKWYIFHMGDWVYFLLFLSPFSYGYKFSQPDRWVMWSTVEPMTNKGCCVMWCPKLFCKQASRYPPKCLPVGGPPNPTELLFSKLFPGALRTLPQGESDGRLQSVGSFPEPWWLP